MRDDRHLWTAPVDWTDALEFDGARLSAVKVTRQVLVSGKGVHDDATIGWPDIAASGAYRISLRRDRVVEINGDARAEGWDAAQNRACSDVTNGFAVIQLTGPNAIHILKRGTEISVRQPSASVARQLFGLDVWLYRHGTPDGFRMHVAHAFEQALIGHLTTAARQPK